MGRSRWGGGGRIDSARFFGPVGGIYGTEVDRIKCNSNSHFSCGVLHIAVVAAIGRSAKQHKHQTGVLRDSRVPIAQQRARDRRWGTALGDDEGAHRLSE